LRDETKCLHSGYSPKNGEPRVVPIVQSTTYVFDSTGEIGDVFDDPTKAPIYSRFANPTVMAVEAKIADLEQGVAAMCTSSGQMATLMAVLNICKAGDCILSAVQVYGGTYNLFSHTLKKLGIDCVFIDANAGENELDAAFRPNTKLVFGETISNPSLKVLDFEKFSRAAAKHNVPFIVDNTFATPVLCKPFLLGADIITHSTTKYMDGHALQVGGVIIDGGRFDWAGGGFKEFTEPDETYHGAVYTEKYGDSAYIVKARMQLMRDYGAYPSANSAFLLNLGLETLPIRMERYCSNAEAAAKYLASSKKVESVNYPWLPGDAENETARKYLKGASGAVTFVVRGGKEKAVKFMDGLKLASNQVTVADIRTCVLHPASSTNRQLNETQLAEAGIDPGMVRLSVGLENIEDIIEDLEQSFEKI